MGGKVSGLRRPPNIYIYIYIYMAAIHLKFGFRFAYHWDHRHSPIAVLKCFEETHQRASFLPSPAQTMRATESRSFKRQAPVYPRNPIPYLPTSPWGKWSEHQWPWHRLSSIINHIYSCPRSGRPSPPPPPPPPPPPTTHTPRAMSMFFCALTLSQCTLAGPVYTGMPLECHWLT